MDGRGAQSSGSDRVAPEAPADPLADIRSVGLSRRDFTTRVGLGSAALVGMTWAAPKVSTVKFARRAVVGSPPPGSTTTTSTTIGETSEGHISVSNSVPCVGDRVRVTADGFAPHTAVTLEIDSAATPLGVTTADAQGKVDVEVELARSGPKGKHRLVAVGVRPGGRTLTLGTPIEIRTEAECAVNPEGSTTTTSVRATGSTTSTTATTTPPTTTPNTTGGGGPKLIHGGGGLAFTGTDAVDLALVGTAATVGGRLLFALARPRDDDEEEE